MATPAPKRDASDGFVEFLRAHTGETFTAEDLAARLGAESPKLVRALYWDNVKPMRLRGVRAEKDEASGEYRYYAIDITPKPRAVAAVATVDNEPTDRPIIDVKPETRPENVAAGIAALATRDDIYVSNQELVRLHVTDGHIELVPFTASTLAVALMQAAHWRHWVRSKNGVAPVPSYGAPTDKIVSAILEQKIYQGIREIIGLTTCPIVTLENREFQDYDDDTKDVVGTYRRYVPTYHTRTGFVATEGDAGYFVHTGQDWHGPPYATVGAIKGQDLMTVAEAREILESPLRGFKFENPEAHTSAVVAEQLTQILRPCINGPVPGLLVQAAQGKAGKSLLNQYIHASIFGFKAATKNMPLDAKKQLNTDKLETYLASDGFDRGLMQVYDNCDGEVGGNVLESCLTHTHVKFRIFFKQKDALVRWTKTLVFNGCEPTLMGHMSRRLLRVQLLENRGTEFDWGTEEVFLARVQTPAQRGVFIEALLTLIADWIEHQKTAPKVYWHSFGAWSAIIPSILMNAGFANPLDACIPEDEGKDKRAGEAIAIMKLVSAVLANVKTGKAPIALTTVKRCPVKALRVRALIQEITGSMGATQPEYEEGYTLIQAGIRKKNHPLEGSDTREVNEFLHSLKLNFREEDISGTRLIATLADDTERYPAIAMYTEAENKAFIEAQRKKEK